MLHNVHDGLRTIDLPTVFRCTVELAEAVAAVPRSEWERLPVNIEGTASPHFERWREWHRRLSRIEEESSRLKRALGATGVLTGRDWLLAAADRQDEMPSPQWESFHRDFADTVHDRIVRLALMKIATAAIDLSGFVTWRERQCHMQERGLRLLTWGLAQLWDGLTGEERWAVRDRLGRTHAAVGWPSVSEAEPSPYNGPEEIPLEDQYRIVEPAQGFVACPADYLDNVQKASNARTQQNQEKFLRRASIAQFAELVERVAHVLRAMAKREFETAQEWGDLYLKAFSPLICLQRAKDVRPVDAWPDDAIEQRDLLADAAWPLLVCIGAVPEARGTLKPEDADKAFEVFITATNRLREIASPQAHGTPAGEPYLERTIAELERVSKPDLDSDVSEAAGQAGAAAGCLGMQAQAGVEVFCSYCHKDESLRKKLASHLSPLKREGIIDEWHDRKIPPGKEWDKEIDDHLNTASVILLLISPEFIESDYCHDVEVTRALERHDSGEACVIPIILRPVDWTKLPFSKLQALPEGGKAVTEWSNRDKAWLDVALGIRKPVEELRNPS